MIKFILYAFEDMVEKKIYIKNESDETIKSHLILTNQKIIKLDSSKWVRFFWVSIDLCHVFYMILFNVFGQIID